MSNKKFSKKIKPDQFQDMLSFWKEQGIYTSNTKSDESIRMISPAVTGDDIFHVGQLFPLALQDIYARYMYQQKKNIHFSLGYINSSFFSQVALQRQHPETKKLKPQERQHELSNYIKEQYTTNHKLVEEMGIVTDDTLCNFSSSYTRYLRKVFVQLLDQQKIYQDKYIAYRNQKYQTVLSSSEVDFETIAGKKYLIRYFIDTKKDSIVVGTTNPETIFADVALAVHPLDKRYKKFVGKKVIIPIINKTIPIVADESVDMTQDNGAIRVTPGHDVGGLKIAKDHNLPTNMYAFDIDGCFTKHCGIFAEKPVDEFIPNIIQYIDDISNLDGAEEYTYMVPICKKTKVQLIPIAMDQRSLDNSSIMDGLKNYLESLYPLTEDNPFLDTIDTLQYWTISKQEKRGIGLPFWQTQQGESVLVSEEMIIDYVHKEKKGSILSLIVYHLILDNYLSCSFDIQDLVELLFSPSFISSDQIILQTYIDAYREVFVDDKKISKEIEAIQTLIDTFTQNKNVVDMQKVSDQFVDLVDLSTLLLFDGETYFFDVDVLCNKKGLKKSESVFDSMLISVLMSFYKQDLSKDTYITFEKDQKDWFLKSTLLSFHLSHKPLGSIIHTHGSILDERNQQMGYDWRDIVPVSNMLGAYPSDVLRMSLVDGMQGDKDTVFSFEKVEAYNHFLHKFWNACRYVQGSDDIQKNSKNGIDLHILAKDIQQHIDEIGEFDLWFLSRMQTSFEEYRDKMQTFDMSTCQENIVSLIKTLFCERYLEITKTTASPYASDIVLFMVGVLIIALYPFAPFVAEALWQHIGFSGLLMQTSLEVNFVFPTKNYKIHLFMDMIGKINMLKKESDIKQHELAQIAIQGPADFLEFIEGHEKIITSLINTHEILYLRQHEELDIEQYRTDNVVDVILGVKPFTQQKEKDTYLGLKKILEQKTEYIQHLKVLVSQANGLQNQSFVDKKNVEIKFLKDEIQDLEYQINKIKSKS